MGAAAKIDDEHIGPQPGPQTAFLMTVADIAIYGGAAGGGKSYGLLLEPLRHFDNAEFGAVIFRRTSTQVRNKGGMWDESEKLYPRLEAHPREAQLQWVFASGMKVKFAHLEHEKTKYDWQGAQIPMIGFDELTHFSESTFWYLLSRNRSVSGVPSYVRATCNPDVDSWVRKFIDWWIDEDGYARQDRSGVLRWFVRINDSLIWGNSKAELEAQYGAESLPKSVTFIPSKLDDNKILIEKDPGYRANLRALNRVDRLRLEGGNWNVRASAGMLFQREWFPIVEAIPDGWIMAVRFWDRAATKPHEGNKDPDWTRGLLLLRYPQNYWLVADLKSMRDTPGQVAHFILQVAAHDSAAISVCSQQDPGSAGVMEAEHFIASLAGYDVRVMITSKDKVTRAKPVSAQAEAGNIKVLRASWNQEFFSELENFGEDCTGHDDIVDVLSGSFNELVKGLSIID